jgi:hypothetical protein
MNRQYPANKIVVLSDSADAIRFDDSILNLGTSNLQSALTIIHNMIKHLEQQVAENPGTGTGTPSSDDLLMTAFVAGI